MRNPILLPPSCALARLALAGLACLCAFAAVAAPAASTATQATQRAFSTPDDAVRALVAAVRAANAGAMARILGPGSVKLIRSGDPVADRHARERFLEAYDRQSRIEVEADAKATLLIGDNDWPFPFPIVHRAPGWQFDARSGAEEVLNRRIGRNELAAIQVCLAYVDAQREYALGAGNAEGMHAYAMRLVSRPGKKDGLYWPVREGEPASPLGPLASKAKEEGYRAQPYHGYYYRILTRQGASARGGAYDYVVDGKMIGGFALVAYPALWGASGVMTFIVNHDGIVYQKNLGPKTAAIAGAMARFDPDSSWARIEP
ncbi:MAG: DUF2950 domain-containing protein [Rudaea sp.]